MKSPLATGKIQIQFCNLKENQMTEPLRIADQANTSLFKLSKFEVSLQGKKVIRLINQVGFSDFFEESKSDDSYRNDPTVEGVS